MNEVIIEVVWEDAFKEESSVPANFNTDVEPISRRNVGYLIQQTENVVVISSGILDNGYKGEKGFDGFEVFPWAIVKEVNVLAVSDRTYKRVE